MEKFECFRFWCYKVLPLIYDDSLSYYEVLCKVVKYINELIEQDKLFGEELDRIKEELAEIEQFIKDFDTEVAERIIREALANLVSVMFTSTITDEDATDSINTAMDNGAKVIYVDSDIYVGGNIYPVSGTKFIGAGGKITMGLNGHFRKERHNTDESVITAVSGSLTAKAMYADVTSTSGINVGERYKIIGNENLFDIEEVGASAWLGSGTVSASTVNGGFEFIVTEISGSRIYFDRPAPYYIGACSVYSITDLHDVVFRDLIIDGYHRIFNIHRCNNICIDNCDIHTKGTESSGSYPVYLLQAYDCEIVNCTIVNDASGSNTDNIIVIATGGDNKITGNRISGGYQAIDVSYFGSISFNNIIANNTVYGSKYDSFTTHPAAIYNYIIGNHFGNDVSLRSKGNVLNGNVIIGSVEISNRCIDQTVVSNNIIRSLYPIKVNFSSDGSEPIETIFINANVASNCTAFISGGMNSVNDNGASSLRMSVTNNIIKSAQSNAFFISIPTADTSGKAPLNRLVASGNTFVDYPHFYLFGNSVILNVFEFKNNEINSTDCHYLYTDKEATFVSGKVDGNNAFFKDTISGLAHFNTGASYPSYPIKGDTFLKNDGTYAIYDGTNWLEISTT